MSRSRATVHLRTSSVDRYRCGRRRGWALTGLVAMGSAEQMYEAGVDVTDVAIPGRHGDLPARGYRARRPGPGPGGADLGPRGGFVAGDLDMAEAHWVAVELAQRGIPVLSVDYNKCIDGVHYPIPSDDVLDAWLWVAGHEEEFEVRAGPAASRRRQRRGEPVRRRGQARARDSGPLPASLVLAYPVMHAELPPSSDELRAAVAARPPVFLRRRSCATSTSTGWAARHCSATSTPSRATATCRDCRRPTSSTRRPTRCGRPASASASSWRRRGCGCGSSSSRGRGTGT